ncbi:palindromic element RPE3 domain-containing protein [Rickettsia endosymbiont of Halotydeus destructor]
MLALKASGDLPLVNFVWGNPDLSRQHTVQLNSERFRQDEFKGEPAQRTKVREHRRILKNSLVSSFMNDAVNKFYNGKPYYWLTENIVPRFNVT